MGRCREDQQAETAVRRHWQRGGFSLVEVVIIVVIIAIIAAIAVPRFSMASQASGEAALKADLQRLRQAIDIYAAEHRGDWPGLRAAGAGGGAQTSDAVEHQLTWFTSVTGDALQAADDTHIFGPYLSSIPRLPVGSRAGSYRIFSMNALTTPGAAGDGFGWEYEHYRGRIRANCMAGEVGSNGIPYYQW